MKASMANRAARHDIDIHREDCMVFLTNRNMNSIEASFVDIVVKAEVEKRQFAPQIDQRTQESDSTATGSGLSIYSRFWVPYLGMFSFAPSQPWRSTTGYAHRCLAAEAPNAIESFPGIHVAFVDYPSLIAGIGVLSKIGCWSAA